MRTQPALRGLPGKLRKSVEELLTTIKLPFPTFQFVKPTSQPFLEKQVFYPFVRPAHLRSSWLVLHEDWAPVLLDSRDERRRNTIRIPLARAKLRNFGPIVLEVYWDAQDLKLWLVDCIYFKHAHLYESTGFTERARILQMITKEILYDTSGYSDCTVKMAEYQSLASLQGVIPEPGLAVEFQPETAGRRRFVHLDRAGKPVAKPEKRFTKPDSQSCMIVDEEETEQKVAESVKVSQPVSHSAPTNVEKPKRCVASVIKDPKSKLPDTFRILSQTGEDYGLAAIRSMDLSFQVRESLKSAESVPVEVQFYEPFQKYEILKLL